MRFLLATIFLFVSLFASGQIDTSLIIPPQQQNPELEALKKQIDSAANALRGVEEEDTTDIIDFETSNNIRNIQAIMHIRQEAEERQKRKAIMQIAIGATFFILLLVGVLRRRKK